MLFKKMIQKEGPYIYENKFKKMVENAWESSSEL